MPTPPSTGGATTDWTTYAGIGYRLNNGAIERRVDGVVISSPQYNAISAALFMDSEDRLNLWFRTATQTGVMGEINFGLNMPNWFDLSWYQGIIDDPGSIILGNQVVLPVADPLNGEQIPGMVESVRFNAGSLEYGGYPNWTLVPDATGLERSYMAYDGVIFNKSLDGVTFTKVIPGEWLLLPTDAGMFGTISTQPGSILLGS